MKKLALSFFFLLVLCSCSQPFSKEGWLNEPEKRGSMVHNLIKKHELVGMQESEIIDLLGEPEQKTDRPARQYVYYLGRAGLGVDDSLLRINFAPNGEVESHAITHD